MKTKTFYVTTAIDYVNAEPHIGHAYQKIVADALARWNNLIGKKVFFLTGTDEHGKKIADSAEKANLTPEKFVENMSEKFKDAWKKLNVNYDRFIRTTDKDHITTVLDFVKKVNKNGDIYKGTYKGLYCTACETYYTEKDCPDKICPVHHKPLEVLEEESYFFKLSKYQKYLLDLYKKNPEFILPEARRHEITNRVKEGLQDLSITRTSFNWGIPFPLDKKHVIYVWFDALINYYSAVNSKDKKKFWPADYHLLGKDNGWFHAVIWPAMLKSAGIKLPKTVFIHGFLTFNGEKISKSLGNAISPVILADKYGADTIRYFTLRQFPFAQGNDGDFSEQALIDRHNNELADKLGNLISRVSTLAEKYELKRAPLLESKSLAKKVHAHLENLEFDKALNEIFLFIDYCNEYIQQKKPWATKDSKVLYQLANAIKDFTILLSPFIPETAEKISKIFNFDISVKSLNNPLKPSKIKKAEILFKKIEYSPKSKTLPVNNIKPKTNNIVGIKNMNELIKYEDFTKLSLKVGTIKKVEEIEGADKLYKLEVDIGEAKHRTILAGIKQHYSKDELKGKQVIVICNLEPRKMRGVESQGMLLAAVSADESKVILLSPEKKIESGANIR
ncbi:MAG: methionine--tRNA ligase [archaeon]|nr:methionine--tRNA ligase [archaeon]